MSFSPPQGARAHCTRAGAAQRDDAERPGGDLLHRPQTPREDSGRPIPECLWAAARSRCAKEWREQRRVTPFALGSEDGTDRLVFARKLYGRRAEVAVLNAALERMADTGEPVLLLVSGQAGVGKSSLIVGLREPTAERRGFFISGKFERHEREIPYFVVAHACRKLVLEVLVGTLSAVLDRGRVDLAGLLRPALEQDLLLPFAGSFRFAHDRVREATYSLIPNTERAAAHLDLGRSLLSQTPSEALGERVFAIANQFDLGASGIESEDERHLVADLNLRAGNLAKASGGYRAMTCSRQRCSEPSIGQRAPTSGDAKFIATPSADAQRLPPIRMSYGLHSRSTRFLTCRTDTTWRRRSRCPSFANLTGLSWCIGASKGTRGGH